MSAYYCHRCDNNRCTSDCVPGKIYGEWVCEFCTEDFDTALEEYTAAAEVLDRTCHNCRDGDRTAGGAPFCNSLGMHTVEGFGCNRFEGKQ